MGIVFCNFPVTLLGQQSSALTFFFFLFFLLEIMQDATDSVFSSCLTAGRVVSTAV